MPERMVCVESARRCRRGLETERRVPIDPPAFDARDVVRHPMVQRIVEAYGRAEGEGDGPES